MIRFYTDEHVPLAVVEGMRRRGVDVLTAREADMLASADVDQLALALGQGRVIVTQDADFLRLHASGIEHGGIVYARQQTSVSVMIRGLMLVVQLLHESDMHNHVEFL